MESLSALESGNKQQEQKRSVLQELSAVDSSSGTHSAEHETSGSLLLGTVTRPQTPVEAVVTQARGTIQVVSFEKDGNLSSFCCCKLPGLTMLESQVVNSCQAIDTFYLRSMDC